MKVIQRFKAKMEAFRERKCEKVKNDTFLLHLTLCFCGRDENRFSASSCLKPCAKNTFVNILLDGILGPQAGFSLFHFYV